MCSAWMRTCGLSFLSLSGCLVHSKWNSSPELLMKSKISLWHLSKVEWLTCCSLYFTLFIKYLLLNYAAQMAFIIVAGICLCLYFLFLCFMVFQVFRNISRKQSCIPAMTKSRRLHYEVWELRENGRRRTIPMTMFAKVAPECIGIVVGLVVCCN